MATAAHLMTAAELLVKPELGRCELIAGELTAMSPASGYHGKYVALLTGLILPYVREQRLGTVLGAETGFIIGRNPDTVRAPDVAVVCVAREHLITARGFIAGAPDLAVEVVSPEDRPREVAAKAQMWIAAGCVSVWVVDPQARTIVVYRSGSEPNEYAANSVLSGEPVLLGFSLALTNLFE